MQLTKPMQERLAKEFRHAASKIAATSDPAAKVYYFSVFYGEAGRVLNWEWDRDLALLHSVTQVAYQAIVARLQAMASSSERVVRLSPAFFEALTRNSAALAESIEHPDQKQKIYDVLGQFAELAYATTGNGFYLVEKGQLRI